MLTLDLSALFTPELLRAFRERWGVAPADADRLALKIARIFEVRSDEVESSHRQKRKDAWLRTILDALVGPEPDFEAWLEALTRGSFDLRSGTMYARAPGKGSPSRFLLRQREMIETLVDRELPAPERELECRAYLDALRQILVSVLLRELKAVATGRAALGPAWPLMVACQDFLSKEALSLIRHFGGDPAFSKLLADNIEASTQHWIHLHCGGDPPSAGKNSYEKGLPPGVRKHQAMTYLSREDAAVDAYREHLWRELGLDGRPDALTGGTCSLAKMAGDDAKIIKSQDQTLTLQYNHFKEANEAELYAHDQSSIDRIRAMLPVLSERDEGGVLRSYARLRAERRAKLREASPSSLPDAALQQEIADYVATGNGPPRGLRVEHAGYFEEEVCRADEDIFFLKAGWYRLKLDYPFDGS